MRGHKSKLVLVGDETCGKTCHLHMFTCEVFPEAVIPTIYDDHCADITIDDQLVELYILDTGGSEKRPLSYPDTNVFLMCFSVDNPDSLQNILRGWSPEIRDFFRNVPIILVGNTTDRRCETKTNVTFEEGQSMAQRIKDVAYMECSAKNNEGVREIFERAALLSLGKTKTSERKCCSM